MIPRVIPVRLKDVQPYVDPIKKYFGLSHPNLELEMFLLDRDPERKFEFTESVSQEEIVAALKSEFPDIVFTEFQKDLLWLVANIYYGTSYDDYNYYMEYEEGCPQWCPIEQDILRLYSFMAGHQGEEKVTIKMGKDTITLSNVYAWVQSVVEKQILRNCLPDVHSKEEAEARINKTKAGHPEQRTKENAIVNGVALFFADEKLIEGRAPKNLCAFIKKYLEMMGLIKPGDSTVDEDWIKSQINNFHKKGKDSRFWTPEITTPTLEELSKPDPMNWVFPIK